MSLVVRMERLDAYLSRAGLQVSFDAVANLILGGVAWNAQYFVIVPTRRHWRSPLQSDAAADQQAGAALRSHVSIL